MKNSMTNGVIELFEKRRYVEGGKGGILMTEHTSRRPQPPGVMIYRSSKELLGKLQPEGFMRLVMAMLEYDGPGTEPQFEEPVLDLAWSAMREHLDADRRTYADTCLMNRYKRFLQAARRSMPPEACPDYETWYMLSEQGSLSAARTLLKCSDV